MNKKLIKAEDDMSKLFRSNPSMDFTMSELIVELYLLGNKEPEARAAFWILMSDGVLEYGSKIDSARLKNDK